MYIDAPSVPFDCGLSEMFYVFDFQFSYAALIDPVQT
jgi:hypothetical protein